MKNSLKFSIVLALTLNAFAALNAMDEQKKAAAKISVAQSGPEEVNTVRSRNGTLCIYTRADEFLFSGSNSLLPHAWPAEWTEIIAQEKSLRSEQQKN